MKTTELLLKSTAILLITSPKSHHMTTHRKLVGLDLDETLIYTLVAPMSWTDHHIQLYLDRHPECSLFIPMREFSGKYLIHKRPHVDLFLKELSQLADVFIWSAAEKYYIDHVLTLFPELHPVFVLDGSRCTVKTVYIYHDHEHESMVVKNLKKVYARKVQRNGVTSRPYGPHNVIMIDNTASTFVKNYGNAIHVSDYVGDPEDTELLRVLDIVRHVVEAPEVRPALCQWSSPPPIYQLKWY